MSEETVAARAEHHAAKLRPEVRPAWVVVCRDCLLLGASEEESAGAAAQDLAERGWTSGVHGATCPLCSSPVPRMKRPPCGTG